MKKIPLVGLGTWELRGKECQKIVALALECGYRHIDTAHLYENHKDIGAVIKSFPREELFLTSKFFPGQDEEMSCDDALKDLQVDYIDLYLLHYPDRSQPMERILENLEGLKQKGKIKEWGVSNCTTRHLKDFLNVGLHPSANQVEFHPFLYQKELLEMCQKENIELISYRTLGKGALVKDLMMTKIAEKHKKTVPQILLRWCIQKNIPVIPKASSRAHLIENISIFDFSLDHDDLAILDNIKEQNRFCDRGNTEFDYL